MGRAGCPLPPVALPARVPSLIRLPSWFHTVPGEQNPFALGYRRRRRIATPLSALTPAMNHRENARDKKQRRERGKNKSANHGAAQRSILFAALAKPDSHR